MLINYLGHRKRDSRTARDFSNKENMHSLLNIVEVDAKTPKDANSEVYKGSVHRSTLGLEKSQDGSIRKSIPQIFFENAALNILNTNFTVSTDNIEHEKLLKNVQIRKKSKERKPLGVLHPKSQSKVSSIVVKNSVCKPNKSLKCK